MGLTLSLRRDGRHNHSYLDSLFPFELSNIFVQGIASKLYQDRGTPAPLLR
jgi:hypothetical protein